MKKQLRRIISLALTAITLFTITPVNARAELITTEYSDGVSLMSLLPTDPPVVTRTYTFKVGDNTVETQIIKNGEYLNEPQVPAAENRRFIGWFVEEEKLLFGTGNPITFTESAQITAIARFVPVYYVFFMESAATTAAVFSTKEGIEGSTIATDDITIPMSSTQAVTGWYKNQNLTDGPVGANFTIGTSNQQLWPKIESGHYLTFISGAQANYVAPQFVPANGTTQEPSATMTRPGYTFNHWSLSENGTAYPFNQTVNSDITLYAVWTPVQTNYSVIFWKQSINDSKYANDNLKTYDYAGETVVRQDITGATAFPTSADKNKAYTGFHYNNTKTVSVVVKGDGSTVLNVYYDRNPMTLEFQTRNGTTIQTMTGLYGQSLAQNAYSFPEGYNWQEYYYGSLYSRVTFLDAFIFDNLRAYSVDYTKDYLILRRISDETGNYYVRHYKQNLNGTYPATANNTNITNSSTFNMTNKYVGFTVAYYATKPNGPWMATAPGASVNFGYNDLYIRHTRNTYKLSFYNFNAISRTENVLFEQSLNEFADYTPPLPNSMPESFVFQGWYKDQAFTQPINLATVEMGPGDLIVYAKWSAPDVHVNVYTYMEGGAIISTQTLPYNSPLDPGSMPTVKNNEGTVVSGGDPDKIITLPANALWIGWTTISDGTHVAYNFNTHLTGDIALYPYYISNERYNVTYLEGAGTGTVTDDKTYNYGAFADVQTGVITPPAGQVFLGWTISGDTSGRVYVANEKIYINGNKTLVAAFGPKVAVDITYQPNGGDGSAYKVDLKNNETHTVLALTATGISRTNYTFLGWNTRPNGSGLWFMPGSQVIVDNVDPESNVLYAQWESYIDITAMKEWNFPAPGIQKPQIWFTLYRENPNGEPIQMGVTKPVPAGAASAVVWNNLPKSDGAGNTYVYFVKETTEDGADFTPPSFEKAENGLIVTNTYKYIDFKVTKVWAGDNLPEVKPVIQIQLQQSNDGGVVYTDVDGMVVDFTADMTQYRWFNLPTQDSNGKDLIYRAIETGVPTSYDVSYEHTENLSTITNTYQSTSITVEKHWSDPGGLKPPSEPWPAVQLQLYKNGEAFGAPHDMPEQATYDPAIPYTHTWVGLPKYMTNGDPNVYTVREVVVPDRYVVTNAYQQNKVIITNTLKNDTVIGAKRWVGELPPAGTTVQLQLYQTVASKNYRVPYLTPETVSAATNWRAQWEDLPVSVDVDGDGIYYECEYEIEEVPASVPTGYYVDRANSGKLYVTNVSQQISFTAYKRWLNGANMRPDSVTLYLERMEIQEDGTPVAGADWERVEGSDYSLPSGSYEYTWTELDNYKTWNDDPAQRVKYRYRVREEPVKQLVHGELVKTYDTEYLDDNTVLNTFNPPTRTVTVTKEWSGGPKEQHIQPTLTLWRRYFDDRVEEPDTDEYSLEVTKNNPYDGLNTAQKYVFTYTGLPNFCPEGHPYLYGWTEEEENVPQGYEMSIETPYLLGGVYYALPGGTITNTYIVPMTQSLTVTKEWVNGPANDHRRVRLDMWRTTDDIDDPPPGGISLESVTWFPATVTPPEGINDTFTGYWPNLAATDNDGHPYTYLFTESIVPENYIRTYTNAVTINGTEYGRDGSKVINTYSPPMDGVATAIKTWINGDAAQHVPVEMTLWRSKDNGVTMEEVTGASREIDPSTGPADTFTYKWSGLQRTDINGAPYQFYFTEDTALPENYTLSYSASVIAGNREYALSGATAYNTYTPPKDDITAIKIWENGPLADHEPVEMTLYRKIEGGGLVLVDAAPTITVQPTNETEMHKTQYLYTWSAQDLTDMDGNPYTYYFSEYTLPYEGKYTCTYETPYETDYGLAGTSVTNSYIPAEGAVIGEKNWVFTHQDALPDVYMVLWRNLHGGPFEPVPGCDPIRLSENALGPAVQDPNQPEVYKAYFYWETLLTNISGDPYSFLVREADSNGNPYTPEFFEKIEVGTTIYNLYEAKGSFTPQATKALTGRPLKEGEFSFILLERNTDGDGNAQETGLETVTNAQDGSITFSPIEYSAADIGKTYSYVIREVVPDTQETGMTYDSAEIIITVTITDNGVHDGVLIITEEYTHTTFNNSYVATGTLPAGIWARKILIGRRLQDGEFNFELRDSKGALLQTVQNDADGNISFSAIEYDQDDIGQTYTYFVNEVIPSPREKEMSYDIKVLSFSVKVTDAGNGKLNVLYLENQKGSRFINTFTPNSEFDVPFTPFDDMKLSGSGITSINVGDCYE